MHPRKRLRALRSEARSVWAVATGDDHTGVETPAESVQLRRCHDVNELGESASGSNPTVYERRKQVRGEVLKVGAVC